MVMYDEYIIDSKKNRPQVILEEDDKIKAYLIKGGVDWELKWYGFLPAQVILQDSKILMWEGTLKGIPKNAWLSGKPVKILRMYGLC